MKRTMGGAGRKGSPPLPRQRRALRVTQITLVALSVWCVTLIGELDDILGVVFMVLAAVMLLITAVWMGIRTVRGPIPPQLD
ncbi:MAG: hypothetical protein ABIS18_02810 [Actinomycetota bacterium]